VIKMSTTARIALVADDDAFFRMALRTILISQIGCSEVIEAGCFDEALERLGEHANISVALFDLSMPGIKTPAKLRVIRETFPSVRVVVVSASDSRYDVLVALEAGVHGYVPKSLGIAELTAALKVVFEGAVYVPPLLPELLPTAERSCLGLTNGQGLRR
jgi:DNA-binding NarL/FixJ family response regulator